MYGRWSSRRDCCRRSPQWVGSLSPGRKRSLISRTLSTAASSLHSSSLPITLICTRTSHTSASIPFKLVHAVSCLHTEPTLKHLKHQHKPYIIPLTLQLLVVGDVVTFEQSMQLLGHLIIIASLRVLKGNHQWRGHFLNIRVILGFLLQRTQHQFSQVLHYWSQTNRLMWLLQLQ